MRQDEVRQRQSNRDKGPTWLHERAVRAGRQSGIVRLAKAAKEAKSFPSKERAYLVGYERGYRAAYKRHYEYWQRRMAHQVGRVA